MNLRPAALTSGDPAGIGIELAAAAWTELRRELPFFLIADRRQAAARHLTIPVCEITDPGQAPQAMAHGLPLFHVDFPAVAEPGIPAPENAAAVISAIEIAAGMAKRRQAAAVCTNPVSKRILRLSGNFPFPGQTEFLANLCGAGHAAMMLASAKLRVVPVTIHVPLSDVPRLLNIDAIVRTAKITHDALLRDFAVAVPRIAVAGLNPHAGEGGEIGEEDREVIAPAVNRLAESGLSVTGPKPADSLFHDSARQSYDAALCMYHDQALIPVKTLDFFGTVNVTLGLPIVRTSPDHGTGFDIAGTGMARPDSLVQALRMSLEIASCRNARD